MRIMATATRDESGETAACVRSLMLSGLRVIDNNSINICRRGDANPSSVGQNNANRIDKINNIISYFQNYLINLHNIFIHNKAKTKTPTVM